MPLRRAIALGVVVLAWPAPDSIDAFCPWIPKKIPKTILKKEGGIKKVRAKNQSWCRVAFEMGNALEMSKPQRRAIAKRVKRLRLRLMVSQAGLAEMMGVTKLTILNLENVNHPGASPNTLQKLAELEAQVRENLAAGKAMRVPR